MPNQGVPVIFKNKIAYGYAEKSVQAYDVSVSDYNALTEQQQLDGSIRFIQGVDAIPNGSNVWAKLGTTPLAEGLPRDCSQAVNQLKSNLTQLIKTKSYNATTTDTGVIAIADLTANNIIPIQVSTSVNNCYHIFGANSSGKLAIRFTDSGGASKVSTAISGTVYYIEI